MTPHFPTFTFPNHFSMVTGMHPYMHGIVGNIIYDRATNRTFSSRNDTAVADKSWWLADPVPLGCVALTP